MVQPASPSRAANGIAESTWPSWPRFPSHWLSTGTRRGGNHAFTSRSAATKVVASPAPTSIRPTTATGSVSEKATTTWPADHQRRPDGDDGLRPEPVDEHPDRHLQQRVDEQLHDAERRQRGGGDASNRSAAATPATPSVLRCSTAQR